MLSEKYAPWWTYSFVALLVIGPLLARGFVLTFDMIFTPTMPWPSQIENNFLWQIVLYMLTHVIPGDIVQKMILFTILLLAGVGGHLAAKQLIIYVDKKEWHITPFVAGMLFMLNPFVYDRFMAGQYLVLLGYSLLPFFFVAFWQFLQKPALKNILFTVIFVTAISIVSLHSLGIVFVIAVVFGVLRLGQLRQQGATRALLLRNAAIGIGCFLLASSYWLVPLLAGKGGTAQKLTVFTQGDFQAFATIGTNLFAKLGNILQLQGFWLEGQDLYTLPQEQLPFWGIVVAIIWMLVIIGGVALWRRSRFLVTGFCLMMAIGVVLAIGFGTSWPHSDAAFLKGYREPQKFVALLAFGYAIFGAYGVGTILAHIAPKRKGLHAASLYLAAILPFLFAPTMLWGFQGQLHAREYPAGWYEINQRFKVEAGKFNVLFLPWHQYMYFGFSEQLMANPADKFFTPPVIMSHNPEFQDAAVVPASDSEQKIDNLLASQDHRSFGGQLADLKVKYIILAKELDYHRYDYLSTLPELQLVQDTPTTTLYRNKAFNDAKR